MTPPDMKSDAQSADEYFERWRSRPLVISIVALALAAGSILAALFSVLRSGRQGVVGAQEDSSLQRTLNTRVLRVGYSGFKPYTIINLDAQDPGLRVTGYCVDMIAELARRQSPPWTVQWVKVNFETLKADMESRKFDVFADAVYQTIPRAAQFGFTKPWGYFGVAVGVVRRGETGRFKRFEDLDDPNLTVSLAEGWTSTEFARQHLSRPKFHVVTVGDDPFVQFQEVISGRADIALQDVPTVAQFVQQHPDVVEAVWLDNPPTRVPAGFMTRQGDFEMLHFLDVGIDVLRADGTLDRLDQKWRVLSDFPSLTLRPGRGLGVQ